MSEYKIADGNPFPEGGALEAIRTREESAPGGGARYVRFPGLSNTLAVESADPLSVIRVSGYLKVAGADGAAAIKALRAYCRTQRALRQAGAMSIVVNGDEFDQVHLSQFTCSGPIQPSFDGTSWCVYQQVEWVWRQLTATITDEEVEP